MRKEDTVVFALSSNIELADEICSHLNITRGKIEVRHFADGEILVEPLESVRGKHVYIIQSTCEPVSETYMEVLIALDACKRASANEITVVMPYYGYARQDRKARARQPISAKLMANLLTTAGANRVVTIDLHAPQIQGFFDIPVDHMQGLPLMVKYFMQKGLYGDDVVVVSPDIGGVKRARKLAEWLDCKIAIIDKRRPKPNMSEVMNLIGEVQGKTAIFIDDMIDTAGTITNGAAAILDRGAKEAYACCTHAVFSDPAIERLAASALKEIIVTDSIALPERKKLDKITVLSVDETLAEAIRRIVNNQSVSELFEKRFIIEK